MKEAINLDPNDDKSFECWVNANFLGQYVKGAAKTWNLMGWQLNLGQDS
jgi:hypothetical protein